ncbi:hypothetical protein [Rhodanobacter sp. L36]|uniref:hypothetical protein n=1 Tax=Rhodanobacter sp. L36 TaxID=1747221 RepID=UPI00131D4F66|nr:hypothetical protein [Rhodanobacter sp. L36]
MNTPLPPDHDDALPGEAELAALYRKLPKSEPGAALDAAVLRAAAKALASDGKNTHATAMPRRNDDVRTRKAPPRWLIGLSSAATVVLVAGLAWRMREPSLQSAPASSQVASTDAGNSSAAPAAPVHAEPMAKKAITPSLPSAPAPVAEFAKREAATPKQSFDESMASLDARKSRRALAPEKIAPEKDLAVAGRSFVVVAPPPVEEPSANAIPSKPAQQGLVADASKAAPPAILGKTNDTHRDKLFAYTTTPSSTPAPEPAPAPEAETVTAPSPAAPVAAVAPMVAAAPPAPIPTSDADDTPAQQLDAIRALYSEHRDNEATPRLIEFHRAHPDWKLPTDLRARLPRP